jgi:hypothetical protein
MSMDAPRKLSRLTVSLFETKDGTITMDIGGEGPNAARLYARLRSAIEDTGDELGAAIEAICLVRNG